ncbi:phospholipase D-like domain-containing protein [Neobacillus vireti]|uniref:phospholipase D-like domain-containing protein n=1 Tax=Neobacillus vireti TaxID=220686 RepID=UPI002FFF51B0
MQIFVLKDLHSKVYLIDNKRCVFGSANFTNKGLNINHELLLYFDKQEEVKKFNYYVNELLTSINHSGNWSITLEQLQIEKEIVESYKESQKERGKIIYSWGADLNSEELVDENPYILSVPAGGTIHLIEKHFVHAHPISSGYNYTPTKYITFRKANGGVMDKIYSINKMFPLEMKEWSSEIEKIDISETVKENVIDYIVNRYRDFEFDKSSKYKFYLLSLHCDLPNEPHPPTNNAGGWLYTLKDLKESNRYVYTAKQMKRKQDNYLND